MDWTAAIDRNREALKRVLAGLLAMAGLAAGAHPEEPGAGERRRTLPRLLHCAVLRLLRPAEEAARRLVIVAARGVVVEPAKPRLSRPRSGGGSRAGRTFFRLFDPPVRFGKTRPRTPLCLPRISFPGLVPPSPVRMPPMPFDPIDAAPLARRLGALASALDDLPRQARRFALWQARLRAPRHAREGAGAASPRRLWPLRPGRPQGQRPAGNREPVHEVHDILTIVHGLALWALEPADTS